MHYFELLRDVVGFDKIKEKVVNPLTGRKIAAYYGCLLLRPGKVMAFDDPENPAIMEEFIRAIGAEPVIYPYRNECCGGYVALEDPERAKRKSNAVTTVPKATARSWRLPPARFASTIWCITAAIYPLFTSPNY